MRSHYELLGIEPSTDTETIKRAFRREIARYHPDKVVHLGAEFQEMASTRAAELTAAYTTLSNPRTRAAYDASLAAGADAPAQQAAHTAPSPAPPKPEPVRPSAAGEHGTSRMGHDVVLRAAHSRLRQALTTTLPDSDLASVNGFDLACLAKAKTTLFRRTASPSVLVRIVPVVDRVVTMDAWTSAAKAGLPQKPLVLLLLGQALAPTSELSQAIDDQRRRNPTLVDALFPVPVDLRDWTPKIPANAPDSVRRLIESLKTAVR